MRPRLLSSIGAFVRAYGAAIIVCAAVAALSAWFVLQPAYLAEGRARRDIEKCKSIKSETEQVECAFSVLTPMLDSYGIESAMRVFKSAYETLPAFVDTGCHKHAHRMGDLTYYRLYPRVGDIEALHFPQETTACGYGFFHGLLEHLLQDNPTPEFATHVCEYLSDTYKQDMGDIRITCYHGVGHGFMLGHSELVPKAQWGTIRAFVDVPFAQCEALPKADTAEQEQCMEGIFNLVADWRDFNQFGFVRPQDGTKLFSVCDELPKRMHNACYFEMAQKLDRFGRNDPAAIAEIVSFGRDAEFRSLAFSVGVGGVMQQVIGKGREYESILADCTELEDPFAALCTKSVINGLFEHGEPQEEYKKPLEACAQDSVHSASLEGVCYRALSERLRRFYTQEKAENICSEFPRAYRDECRSLTRTP